MKRLKAKGKIHRELAYRQAGTRSTQRKAVVKGERKEKDIGRRYTQKTQRLKAKG